jgi:hypothetical protein
VRVGLFWYGFRLVRLVIIMNFITKIKQKNRGYTVDLVYIYIYIYIFPDYWAKIICLHGFRKSGPCTKSFT